ncbi:MULTISPECIES: universal stress protein [unclassified Roseitalea]|uniref:universal stress protein n=1 Tax=unclassified Roseitalea TaxID=2639107 RepID=UPI00273DD70A|nr:MULTISPECIES: universal stress protein [unclassified Roseitalea]
MYRKIMTPVDLRHTDQLGKALKTAADLARHYDATVCYVSVAAAAPGPVGHNPQEFAEKLSVFAKQQADEHGIKTEIHPVTSHDPTTDLDDALLKCVGDIGADLVVMASHVPTLTDYIWPSNGGRVAGHAKASVFVVRDA